MNSLIGISVRGKTYFFINTFSKKQMLLLKDLATNYRKNLFIDKDADTIIKQFIFDANVLLECSLHLVDIEEILILK